MSEQLHGRFVAAWVGLNCDTYLISSHCFTHSIESCSRVKYLYLKTIQSCTVRCLSPTLTKTGSCPQQTIFWNYTLGCICCIGGYYSELHPVCSTF